MARATRSSAADLKRKRSVEELEKTSNDEHGRTKVARTAEEERRIDGLGLLGVLEAEDSQGLLDRVFGDSPSLRALLSTPTPVSQLMSAISHLRPISSRPRASLSPTAAQQLRFCTLALSALRQLDDSSPPRPRPTYALVQHLPSGDYWSSLAHLDDPPQNLHTAHAELVAIFPDPSSSTDTPAPTLSAYSTRPLSQKRPPPLAHRRVTTGTFLDYGLYSSFAPAFDQDGEVVGKNQLSQALWYREENKRRREALRRERLEGTGSIVDVTPVHHPIHQSPRPDESPPDLQLEALLPPEDVDAIKAALNSLELEKSVQSLLDQNKRALERLEELQFNRLTNHPTSNAEEGSEEWEIAHAILDSLTLLASLRPRSKDLPAIIPPPSVLHKLHRTLAIEPSPGWYGTLPASRTTALRDDSTVKVRPGAVTPAPATNPPAVPAPTPTNTFGSYSYAYAPQQQAAYRPQQAAAYTPYKPGQASSFYQGYMPAGTQQQTYYSPQTYATGTTNQQPYGAAATGQQPYATSYSAWYGQYPTMPSGTGSGRGTPQPVATTPAAVASTYGSFFNTTVTPGSRTPAIANTVVANAAAASTAFAQTTAPTLPVLVRAQTNGSPAPYYAPAR